MIRDLNKIFELWKGKVGSKRTPNPKSAEHQYQLREILNDLNWYEEVINELLYNLTEEEFRAIKKDTGNVSTFKTKQARDAAVSRGTHSEEGGEVEDEEDRTSGSEDATEGMTRYEKKRYEAWLNGETTQQQDQSDYLTEEDKKLMEDFDKDLDEYLAEKDPNKKKKLLQAMVDTYQLSMNAPSGDPPQPTKLYIGAISFDARKIFSGDSGNALSP